MMLDRLVDPTSGVVVVGWGNLAMTRAADAEGSVLPTGTVAFLLTDVEGSTRLWETDPDAMSTAMDRHNEIVDEVVAGWGGLRPVAQGEGDSVVAVFSRASDAVLAAVGAQLAFTAEVWPTPTPLRVRMAVHVGEARSTADRNYAGQAIIRAARLREIAHGGQILVSEPARDLVVDNLGDRVGLRDLGEHRLRDLARAERVFQVSGDGLPDDFEPLRSLDLHHHNLPVQLSSFIGRGEDIATVASLVRTNRLVTIVGAGGSGKTRLAQQAAGQLVDLSVDGTWWVELADVRDPDRVVAALAATIGVRGGVGAAAADDLAHVLAERALLLVLDNCEHLVEAVAYAVPRLLLRCPRVRVLATSREPLGLRGELAWRIPPLATPGVDGVPLSVAALSAFDGARLFVDRAQRVRPGFAPDDGNAPVIAAICRRLDGVPLAIELAAARCRSMTPVQVLDALTDTFRVLTDDGRDALPRHATLEASMTWSHDLLTVAEQTLLRRLSVFAGGSTLDAAEAVCSDDAVVPSATVLKLLDRLVVKSFVELDDTFEPARYRVHETVRQYGARRLDDAGETEGVRDRHLAHYQELLLDVWPSWTDIGLGAQNRRVLSELDNVIVALEHAAHQQRWDAYATLAVRATMSLAFRLPDQARALIDRVPHNAVEARAVEAELAYARGWTFIPETDDRSVKEFDRALELGSDGVHPGLVAQAMQARLVMSGAIYPIEVMPAVAEAAVWVVDHPFADFLHSVAAMIAFGTQRGLLSLADPYRTKMDSYLHQFGDSEWAVIGESFGAWLSLDHGDFADARARAGRARECMTRRGAPTTWLSAVIDAVESLAETHGGAIGHGPDEIRELIDACRRQRLDAGARRLGRALGALLDAAGDPSAALSVHVGVEHEFDAGNEHLVVHSIASGGRSALAAGLVDEAHRRADRVDAICRRYDSVYARGTASVLRAEIALVEGDRAAAAIGHAALAFASTRGYRVLHIDALEALLAIAGAHQDHVEVARLTGAVSRARDDLGYRMRHPGIRDRVDTAIEAARMRLGDEAFGDASAGGERLSLDEITAYVSRGRGERGGPPAGWASLTPKEQDVAAHACRGLTNPQIADKLLMSRDTVKSHLSHIYAKLGVANRTELATALHEYQRHVSDLGDNG